MFDGLISGLRVALDNLQETNLVEDFNLVMDITMEIQSKAEDLIVEYLDE